ncbi:MAG: winged helix-turn-helix domain-containing protein [Desulfobacca sp.]|nr:winged helix-turn-helix domain-containing protein [Desulfobacca sp.]
MPESFRRQALTGQVARVAEIKATLERRVSHQVHKTTVYRLLKRHGWRKWFPGHFLSYLSGGLQSIELRGCGATPPHKFGRTVFCRTCTPWPEAITLPCNFSLSR